MTRRRRITAISIALVLMALGAVLGSGITLDNDLSRLLPDRDPAMTRATAALQQLMLKTLVDVGATTDTTDPERLGAVADALTERLRALDGVRHVRATVDPDEALELVELVRDHAPLLLDADQLKQLEADLEPDRVVATIQALARKIQQPDGAHLKATAAIDPLGIRDQALAPLRGLDATFQTTRLVDGRLMSADGRHVLLMVELAFGPSEADRNAAFHEQLERVIGEVAAPGVRIRHFGAHRATLDNVTQIRADVARTSTVGIGCVALLAILCFGRIWLSLLALLPALCGGLCAFGVLAVLQDHVAGAVLGFGAVLLGLTIDFAIHVLFRLDRGAASLPVRALYMGGTTTSLAFLALQASALPALRDISVFGAVGVFAAVLFALYVLPAIVRGRSESRPWLDLSRVVGWLARGKKPALLGAVLATPVLAVGAFFVTVSGDPSQLSALSTAAAADDQAIQAVFGQSGQMSALVVTGPDLDTALAANDRLRRFLDAQARDGSIRGHGSIAGILPATTTQSARARAWSDFWSPDRLTKLAAALDAATERSPFKKGAFQPFLTSLEESLGAPRQPTDEFLVYGSTRVAPMRALLEDRISQDDGTWRVSTPVFTDSWEQTVTFADALARAHPDVTFLNRRAFAHELGAMVTGEVLRLGLLAFALVAFVVFAWHGRVLVTLAIVTPLLLSLVWTLGLLGFLGVPISLANAIFVVFLFGIAVDYAIFLAHSRLEHFTTGEDRTQEAQASVLLCTLTTCAGFGALAIAGHPVLHSIGVTALVGVLATAVATQIFVPLFMGMLLKHRGPNGTPGVPNVRAAFWIYRIMILRGLHHLLFAPKSEREAMDAIRRMALRIRDEFDFIGDRSFADLEQITEQPCILVANHESMYDIMAVLALPRPIQIVVKDWVLRAPVMGSMVKRAGYLPAAALDVDTVRARLDQGYSILLFPEGKRTRTGQVGRFHNGAFALARALGVPVQPLAMVNTRSVCPHRAWWCGDHACKTIALPPMDPAEFTGEGADRRMARAARDRIREVVRAHWLDTQFGHRWWATVGGMYRYLGPVVSHYAVAKCKHDPLVFELPRLCPGDDSILVAGGGVGIMANRLALAFPERTITMIDNDDRKTALCRAAIGEQCAIEVVTADLRTAELPEATTALLIDVLHYWDEATQEILLQRIAAALPAGGRLLFREGCAERGAVVRQERLAMLFGFTRRRGPLQFRSREGWQALLESAGLAVAEVRDDLGTHENVLFVCTKTA